MHLLSSNFVYGACKYLVCKSNEIKCNNYNKIIQKIINFDNFTKENIKNTIEVGCELLIIHVEY